MTYSDKLQDYLNTSQTEVCDILEEQNTINPYNHNNKDFDLNSYLLSNIDY